MKRLTMDIPVRAAGRKDTERVPVREKIPRDTKLLIGTLKADARWGDMQGASR